MPETIEGDTGFAQLDSDENILEPLGGGEDDGPRMQEVLDAGQILVLKKGLLYTINTTITLPTNAEVFFNGCTINATIPVGDHVTDAIFLCQATTGAILVLAADPVVGATSFTVTSVTGLMAGGFVEMGQTNNAQMFRVLSITGASNPFTVHLDRPIQFPYTIANGATVIVAAPPQNIRIHGQGALINVLQAGRGMEMSAAYKCLVEDLTLRGSGSGAYSTMFAYDVTSYGSALRNVELDAAGTGTSFGLMSENNDSCVYDNVVISNAVQGMFAYSGTRNKYQNMQVRLCSANGLFLDDAGGTPSYLPGEGNLVLGGTLENNGGTGILITDGGANWEFVGSMVRFNGTNGITLNTDATKGSINTIFNGVRCLHNTNSGLAIQTGSNVQVIGGEYANNGSGGIIVSQGVKGTTIGGGVQTHDNLVAGIGCSDDAVIDGWYSEDDEGAALLTNNAAIVQLGAHRVTTRSRAANWHGIESNGTSEVRCGPGRITVVSATAWAPTTVYVLKHQVVNSSKIYQCIGAGTSAGSGGPTGTGSIITDGTVTWRYVAALADATKIAVIAQNTSKIYLSSFSLSGGGTYGTDQTAVYGIYNNGGQVFYGLTNIDLGAADAAYTGAEALTGTVTASGTTGVDVTFPNILATSHVTLTLKTKGGTPSAMPAVTITAGSKFTVTSYALDTSVYNYLVAL